jgi:hypothetical protein
MNGGGGPSPYVGRQVTLETWIATIARDVDQPSVLTAITVNHVMASESGTMALGDEVFGKQVQVGKDFDAGKLAAEIQGRCDTYAQALPGVQTFKIRAYYGSKDPGAFHHVTASGRLSAGAAGGTEDATPRGQTQQAMRSMDLIMNRCMGMIDRMWSVAETQMARSEESARYYQGQFRIAETALHELVRERVVDNNAHEVRMAEFTRATGERADLIKILPALIRHITGDDSIIPAETADTAILETVVQKLRKMPKAEAEGVAGAIARASPELAMLLAPRFKEIEDRQVREEAARKMFAAAQASEAKEHDAQVGKEILAGKFTIGGGGKEIVVPAESEKP